LYRDGLEGRNDTLKPLRFQFKDYADWANKQLEGQRLQELQQYWLTKFSKPYVPATFPYSFPGRTGNAGTGANIDFIIDGEIAEKVRAVARQADVTPFVVLFAAVQILLSRYTGSTDLVTGSPFSGRNRLDLEGQTGCYINLMPLRMQVEEDDDLITVVGKARDCITGAHRHQDFPVDMLTEQLETRPANARMLLFNILIQSQDDLEQKLEQPGEFSIRQIDTQAITCKADITFNFKDASKGLLASLEYDTELYEQTDIERIIINLNQLLRQMTADPTKKASPLSSLNKQSWKTDYYSEKA
jgi:non-ribosomal peptide synthetase component F